MDCKNFVEGRFHELDHTFCNNYDCSRKEKCARYLEHYQGGIMESCKYISMYYYEERK